MIKQTRALLYYLGRYLETTEGAGARLRAAYAKEFRRPLARNVLWRHIHLKTRRAPEADIFLFYLLFLLREKAVTLHKRDLVAYAQPQLVRAKK